MSLGVAGSYMSFKGGRILIELGAGPCMSLGRQDLT